MELKREFFERVRKTVIPRPVIEPETDVLAQWGSAKATDAIIYGPNWYHDREQDLIEIYDAGPALNFRQLIPKKNKYEREGLYLLLSIAYRTTENANANIRSFSGWHVALPNAVEGAMFVDKETYNWVSDDCCININSIFLGEKLWLQRVDWEWVSRDTIYDDEYFKDQWLHRTKKEVDSLYAKKHITQRFVQDFLIERIKTDPHFAKRCLMLLNNDKLHEKDLVSLYKDLGIEE
ncbi:MAG: hypothetical protein ACMUIP_12530 [bacterium]